VAAEGASGVRSDASYSPGGDLNATVPDGAHRSDRPGIGRLRDGDVAPVPTVCPGVQSMACAVPNGAVCLACLAGGWLVPLTVRLRTLGSSTLDGHEAMPLAVRRIAPGSRNASTSGRRSTVSGPNAVSSAPLEGRDGKCGMDASGAGAGLECNFAMFLMCSTWQR
jgi:hypothetical protein